jgi:hypothetical protein
MFHQFHFPTLVNIYLLLRIKINKCLSQEYKLAAAAVAVSLVQGKVAPEEAIDLRHAAAVIDPGKLKCFCSSDCI